MALLELKDITFVYGQGLPFSTTALDHVSLSVEKGEFIGVIGHTGSGKSTLIQHMNGLIRPTSGQVLLNGKDIWEDPKKIRQVRFQVAELACAVAEGEQQFVILYIIYVCNF